MYVVMKEYLLFAIILKQTNYKLRTITLSRVKPHGTVTRDIVSKVILNCDELSYFNVEIFVPRFWRSA